MTILNDDEIWRRANEEDMISPFVGRQVKDGISYGLSSYGYDVRVGTHFKIFTPPTTRAGVVDAKDFKVSNLFEIVVPSCDPIFIPPNSFALAASYEWIKVPRDILVICLGKSTYARCGIIVNVTPLEPEWEGNITIEISNTSSLPCKIYPMEGITQLIFLKADEVCRKSYEDRKGKYQAQKGVVLPKV